MKIKEKPMHSWVIEKEGHQFICSYESKTDFVYVHCNYFNPGTRSTIAGNSGPEIIANLLASEIINQDKKF